MVVVCCDVFSDVVGSVVLGTGGLGFEGGSVRGGRFVRLSRGGGGVVEGVQDLGEHVVGVGVPASAVHPHHAPAARASSTPRWWTWRS